MTIAEFLLARIAEDEYAANLTYETAFVGTLEPSVKGSRYDLAVRMGPERVLAECQAKRAIVEDYRSQQEWIDADLDAGEGGKGRLYCYRDVVRALAAVYADHPDYQQEWKP